MLAGDFETAWAIQTAVMAANDPVKRDDPSSPYHQRWVWDGRPFQDRDVLVRCYHGLGDTLQFARYLPILGTRTRSLTLEVQPCLVPLLAGLAGVDRMVPFRMDAPLPPTQCDLEIMELAFALRLAPEQVPPTPVTVIKAHLPAGTVGLCWQGGDWDESRSLPPALLRPFTLMPCLSLVTEEAPLRLLNPHGCPKDMVLTASLVAGCDHIITVDTMIAHLAGTLGIRTSLLLKQDADWRWMRGRSDSPWYPSLKLYRQPEPGDWASVLLTLTRDLKAAAGEPGNRLKGKRAL